MTVVLNNAALAFLLDAEDGPVGLSIRRRGERVLDAEQANVRGYFGTAPSLHGRVDQDVGLQMDGSTAVIGFAQGAGRKAERLAQAEADGQVRVGLRNALEAAGGR